MKKKRYKVGPVYSSERSEIKWMASHDLISITFSFYQTNCRQCLVYLRSIPPKDGKIIKWASK